MSEPMLAASSQEEQARKTNPWTVGRRCHQSPRWIEEDCDLRCNSSASRGRTSKIGGANRRRSGKSIVGIKQYSCFRFYLQLWTEGFEVKAENREALVPCAVHTQRVLHAANEPGKPGSTPPV